MAGDIKVKKVSRAFGQVVRKRRLKLKLSQEAFAEKAEIHRTYVSGIELGKVDIGISVAYKIAAALNTSLSKLFSEIEKIPSITTST
jgi:transcriptional regulator with XRE-family HTH domain